jgi:anion-transporting  ArsA/GET3 family ATPase
MPHADTLEQIVMSRRVVVAVGAGGVGKTTTAAALGVAAAMRGRRVLCLTIDPARRLAEALGLERLSSEEQAVDPARFANAGLRLEGSLVATMLDTKRTFDELVIKYSSSPARARRLLDNKLYRYVSTSLAGTQEYMATEKLVAVKNDPRFDLIILDTPPTANALDFLDAPERLVDALDSSAMRWIVQAFESTGKMSLNLMARSAAVVLRGIARVTGAGFLEAMAEFLGQLNELFGGFKERARSVEAALRSPEVAFVLVTTPAPMSLQEVLFFSDRLRAASMPQGAFVLNRVHMPPPLASSPPTEADAAQGIAERGLALDDDGPERLVQSHGDWARQAALDAASAERLRQRAGGEASIVRVPELTSDVRDLASLARVADTLMRGGV